MRALTLLTAIGLARIATSQCKNQITMVPRRAMKAAAHPRDFVRFKYSLSRFDKLLIRSHEDTETSIGPYDLGFLIEHSGTTIRSVTLRGLPEFRREDYGFSEAFTTVAVTRACGREEPIYFLTMKYMGDELSPVLVYVIIPSAQGYEVLPLPMFSGGTVDVSTRAPLRLRVWNNLNEGMCNACKTAYQITDYEIRDGKFVQGRRQRTRRLYSSDQFDESRIRFTP
ncbi:MAG: hypothetical protein ACRD27_01420 [Terracidiphilus sp.]